VDDVAVSDDVAQCRFVNMGDVAEVHMGDVVERAE